MNKRLHLLSLALLVAVSAMSAHAAIPDARALLQKYDCYMCHADREAKAGPAFADMAAKYRGNAKARGIVTATVKKGRHGGGPWPMPPMPKVPDTDARKIADYILVVPGVAASPRRQGLPGGLRTAPRDGALRPVAASARCERS